MTDLLMRLAERTLGTAPSARPVIASMFESMPAPGSSLSTPEPEFSDVEEMVEVDAPAIQPPIPPLSPLAGASGIETRQDAIVSIPREQARRPAPVNATMPPGLLVNAAPVELTLEKHSPGVPIVPGHPTEASTPTTYVQSNAGLLPRKAQPSDQTLPPEIHAQPEARGSVEQRRAGDTFPLAHQQEQPPRGTESASFLVQMSRQEVTPPQQIIHEVIALETAPALPSQQQGRRPGEGSTSQEAGRTRPANESGASQGDQLMLVPTRSATQVIMQSIEQAPANQQLERGIENRSSRYAVSQQLGQVGPRIVEKPEPGTAEAPAEVPTIRVTIGRIDVRAVTPAAPPARAKPTRTGPAVSLEEYTRQNRGGQ